MNIEQLVEHLQGLIDSGEALPETEVRIAHQPSYPLQATLAGVANFSAAEEEMNETEEALASGELEGDDRTEALALLDELRERADDDRIIYLVARESTDYAPRVLWDRAQG